YRSFYKAQERLLRRYMEESAVKSLPATLEEYEKQMVTPTLERQKKQGVVAVKFEAAYLRALDFARVERAGAATVYARYARGGQLPAGEYKLLQDYLFRFISMEAGRLKLPVHIHACGGAGGYYKLGGTNPAHLDGVFSDPALRKTNFVLVHGGWPYTKETAFLIAKPNVYVDMSAMVFVLYPRQVSQILRDWLEMVPEHVLYGGDVEPFMPQINWEETAWLTVTTGRRALAMALAGMVDDGVITRQKALQIARGVMRGNAASLYGFPQ
ncbi:MAG: amidohydrolase family protein, partial [Acidobacteriia bacterium]|nr:amidohydrolase family protein [Terriglobia bacterium]